MSQVQGIDHFCFHRNLGYLLRNKCDCWVWLCSKATSAWGSRISVIYQSGCDEIIERPYSPLWVVYINFLWTTCGTWLAGDLEVEFLPPSNFFSVVFELDCSGVSSYCFLFLWSSNFSRVQIRPVIWRNNKKPLGLRNPSRNLVILQLRWLQWFLSESMFAVWVGVIASRQLWGLGNSLSATVSISGGGKIAPIGITNYSRQRNPVSPKMRSWVWRRVSIDKGHCEWTTSGKWWHTGNLASVDVWTCIKPVDNIKSEALQFLVGTVMYCVRQTWWIFSRKSSR